MDVGSDGLLPDRTLLLDLPMSTAGAREVQRDGGITDRFSIRDADFRNAVFRSFRAMAEAEPDRFRTVDASGDPETVTTRLIAVIEDLL